MYTVSRQVGTKTSSCFQVEFRSVLLKARRRRSTPQQAGSAAPLALTDAATPIDKGTGALGRWGAIFQEIVTVRILLSLEKIENLADSQCAGCNIHVKGVGLFAKTRSQDVYAMIDELMEMRNDLVRQHKGKFKVHCDDKIKHAGVAA